MLSTLIARIGDKVARNTLDKINATRDWHIYCDFAQSLIGAACQLYVDETFALDLNKIIYALDATAFSQAMEMPSGRVAAGDEALDELLLDRVKPLD